MKVIRINKSHKNKNLPSRRHRRPIKITIMLLLIIITMITLPACTVPRVHDMDKTLTAYEKTQSSQLNGADMSIGDTAAKLLESDYAAFSDIPETGSPGENTYETQIEDSNGTEVDTSDQSIPGQGTKAVPESEASMEISGKYVSKQYMEFRTALYAAASSEKDPQKAAEDLIKKQIAEWNFAEEKGILPTDEEVMSYCENMRSDSESDIESRENMLVIVQNMGLNEAEYFRVFLPRYEVPFILNSEKVSRYCTEHDIEMPDISY